jgi:Nuclease-related domain
VPPIISVVFIIAPVLIIFGILYLFRFYMRQEKRRSPFTEDFLRSPGQSLLSELDAVNEDLMVYYMYALLMPLVIYAIHISMSYFSGIPETHLRIGVAICLGFGLFAFSMYKVIKLLGKRRRIRLGYEGELAVGQELDRLMLEGFGVYHDFPAEKFNIDHVVVGPKGVFAVETKARSKPTTKNRVEDATVEYDGRMLYFPKGDDFKTIDQAKRQASWLSDWLGKATGEPIAARAIVALPGWFVKRTSSEGIAVVNPRQFPSLFEHIKPRPLSESMLTRINHQLDQKCRDIAPQSKNFDH